MNIFGSSKRRAVSSVAGQSSYDYRLFLTSDARQYAFDDDMVITTSQSGLAGLRPLWNMLGVETPNGFDFMTALTGLGGNPAPVVSTTPLIDNPQNALSYLQDQPNYTGGNQLY